MVIKRRCVWNKTFPFGQFMLHFTTFIMFLYIREMTTKASNELLCIKILCQYVNNMCILVDNIHCLEHFSFQAVDILSIPFVQACNHSLKSSCTGHIQIDMRTKVPNKNG